MNISRESYELFNKIEAYSKEGLKNKNDVRLIIEITLRSENEKTFHDIIFLAKYLRGLLSVLKSKDGNESDIHHIPKLYTEYLTEFKNKLEAIIGPSHSSTIKFENDYFSLGLANLNNLNSLIEDLSVCKEYFNSIKYGGD